MGGKVLSVRPGRGNRILKATVNGSVRRRCLGYLQEWPGARHTAHVLLAACQVCPGMCMGLRGEGAESRRVEQITPHGQMHC